MTDAGPSGAETPPLPPLDVQEASRCRTGVPVPKAVRDAVVGSCLGGVTVENDDPMPEVSAIPVADRVTEGQDLTWQVSPPEAAGPEIPVGFGILPAEGGAELSTTDVDPQCLMDVTGESPSPNGLCLKSPESPFSRVYPPVASAPK